MIQIRARDAHRAVKVAVREGRIAKQPCEQCGNPKTDAHHDDYLKPTAVRWLCRSHHLIWHELNGPGANLEGPRIFPNWRKCRYCKSTAHQGNNCPDWRTGAVA